jgi:hypothetical protein
LSPAEERYIFLLIKKNRKITYDALVGAVDGKVSKSTIRRVVHKHYKHKWKSMQRIPISKETARKRLQFSEAWIEDIEELMEVWQFEDEVACQANTSQQTIFSDKSTIQSQHKNTRFWVFRKPHEKFLKALVNLIVHGKSKISVMVWAAITRDNKSKLVMIERDSSLARNGYTAKSYQKALQEGLLPFYNSTCRFQQDNARIHNFGGTPEWLQVHGIEYIDWPPYSPDLNPIEHVWKALKSELMRIAPYLRDLNNNEVSRAELKRCLQLAWDNIPQSLI